MMTYSSFKMFFPLSRETTTQYKCLSNLTNGNPHV